MIACPNCSHSNPDGAIQCEACYTPLPVPTCPSCGATVQTTASFCGQCGFDLYIAAPQTTHSVARSTSPPAADSPVNSDLSSNSGAMKAQSQPTPLDAAPQPPIPMTQLPANEATQIQVPSARLFHVQTETLVEFPQGLSIIHIGKPNDRIPPDIDVAGFPDAEIVSRIHATIRLEAGLYYIEDAGSSNGTYINNLPLPQGNRHRLRSGDRIALGKEDKVSFIFQRAN